MHNSILRRLAVLFVAAGVLFSIPVTQAVAADGDLITELASRSVSVDPLVVDGATILVRVHDSVDPFRITSDGGSHWAVAPLPEGVIKGGHGCAFGRPASGQVLITCNMNADGGDVWLYSLADNKVVGSQLQVAKQVGDSLGARALVSQDTKDARGLWIYDFSKSPVVTQYLGAESKDASFALDTDGALVYGPASQGASRINKVVGSDARQVMKTVPAASSPAKSGLGYDVRIAGDVAYYNQGDAKAGAQWCFVRISDATKGGCVALAGHSVRAVSDQGTILKANATDTWSWLPAGDASWGPAKEISFGAFGDPSGWSVQDSGMPVAVGSKLGGAATALLRVADDGSVERLSDLSWVQVPAAAVSLALTPTSVLGMDLRDSGEGQPTAWDRPLGESIGSETLRGVGPVWAGVAASGSRWVVLTGKQFSPSSAVYDQGTRVRITPDKMGVAPSLRRLSGPYLLMNYKGPADRSSVAYVENVATMQRSELPQAIDVFGPRVLESIDQKKGTFRLRDLTNLSAPGTKIQFNLGGLDQVRDGSQLWGDWIAVPVDVYVATDSAGVKQYEPKVILRNVRTGAQKVHQGSLMALGDGFAVIQDDKGAQVWNFLTDATTALAASPTVNAAGQLPAVTVDGNRVAYSDSVGAKLHVQSFAGVASSAPRVLGVVSNTGVDLVRGSGWSADIDTTKPLKAGQLEVRNSSGTVVRSIAVSATDTGSVRDLKWDGKDSSGNPVPSGTYNYSLTSEAVDGTGALRAADGVTQALGTISVARPFDQGSTPKVNGTPTFGKVLTAVVGSWFPTPSGFRYQWLRDGKPIPGATKSSYQVGVSDVGHLVSVAVTATKIDRDPTVKSSAAQRVAALTFTKRGSVAIWGSVKVGKAVKASVGKFSPNPSAYTYQWMRNGKPIAGATKSGYKLTRADRGKKVSVRVIASRPGYASVVVFSASKKAA